MMVSNTVTLPDWSVKAAPSFARAYMLRTATESNKHGSWFGYEIGDARDVSQEEFRLGATFHQAVMSGTIKVAAPEQEESSDDVPF